MLMIEIFGERFIDRHLHFRRSHFVADNVATRLHAREMPTAIGFFFSIFILCMHEYVCDGTKYSCCDGADISIGRVDGFI